MPQYGMPWCLGCLYSGVICRSEKENQVVVLGLWSSTGAFYCPSDPCVETWRWVLCLEPGCSTIISQYLSCTQLDSASCSRWKEGVFDYAECVGGHSSGLAHVRAEWAQGQEGFTKVCWLPEEKHMSPMEKVALVWAVSHLTCLDSFWRNSFSPRCELCSALQTMLIFWIKQVTYETKIKQLKVFIFYCCLLDAK